MICSEGSPWQRFVRHDRHALSLRRARKNGGRVYLLAHSWPRWADDVQFVDEIRRERMIVRASSSACWSHTLSPQISLPGDSLFAGTEECFMFAFTLACYTPRRCCSAGAVNRSGQQGANEMYHWPHNPAALNTLLCVYTRTLTSNTHRELNLEANTHRYLSQALHHIKCVVMLDYISLILSVFLIINLD